eukprot:COSAG02_NODE_79_length_40228_cov_18.435762_4_plen_56_part_00
MVTIKFANLLVIIEHNNGNGSVENSRSRQTRRPMIRCYNHGLFRAYAVGILYSLI